ncbi:hypothetical protein DFH28DRAFT_19371 [Melampsora americana]|nr:hypothetical protein DFH28DRAFT_19371 [Melampsora americana]
MRLQAAHILLAIAPAIFATEDSEKTSESSSVYHSIVGRRALTSDYGAQPGNDPSLDTTLSNPSLNTTSSDPSLSSGPALYAPSNSSLDSTPVLSSSGASNLSLGSNPSLYGSSNPSNLSFGSTPALNPLSQTNSSRTGTPSLGRTSKVTAAVSKTWEQMLENALNATLATLPGLENVADEVQRLVSAQVDNLENQTTVPELQNAGDSINKTAGLSINGSASNNVTQSVTGEGEMQGHYANGTKCEAQAYVTLSATSLTTLSGLFVAMRTLEETVSKDGTQKTTTLVEKIKACISYSMLSVIKIVATPEVTQCKVAPAQTVFSSRVESNMTLIGQMIAQLKQSSNGQSSLTLNNTLGVNANSTVQANVTKTTRKPCKTSHRLQGGKSGILGNPARNITVNSPLNSSTGEAQYIQGLGNSPSNSSTGEAQYIQGLGNSPSNSSTGEAQYIQGLGDSPSSSNTGGAQFTQGTSGNPTLLQKRNATTFSSVGPALYRSAPNNMSSVGPALYRNGTSNGSSIPSNGNSTLSGGYNSAFDVSSWSSDDDENCDPTLPPIDDDTTNHEGSIPHQQKNQAIQEVEKCYNATIPAVTGVINSNPMDGPTGIHLGKSSQAKIKVNVASYVTIKSPIIYNFITQVNGGSGARTDDDDITPPKNSAYPGSGYSGSGYPSPGYPTSGTNSPSGSNSTTYPGDTHNLATYPSGGPSSPFDNSGYPSGGPSSPSDNSGYPSGGPSSPSDNSGYPSGGPSSPSGNSGYPSGGPSSPSDNSGYPSGGPSSPSDNSGYPSGGPSSPTNSSGYPSGGPSSPSDNSGYPSGGPSSPTNSSEYPSGGPSSPSDNSGYPSGGPSNPSNGAGYPSGGPSSPMDNSGYPSGGPSSPSENPSGYPSGGPSSPSGGSSVSLTSPSGPSQCVCGPDKETHLRIRSLEAQVASVHRMMRKRGLTEL